MIDPKILDELSKRFTEMVPAGVRQLQTDMEKNFHAVLQATFAKMDLVTREEFDVQQAVLARTRTKLEDLEKQLTALEEKMQARRRRSPASPPDTPA
jgi:ubiquinone biosynthesis accessory factor UbiK